MIFGKNLIEIDEKTLKEFTEKFIDNSQKGKIPII